MEPETKPTVDYRFKIIYALAMIMVVGGHCFGGGIDINFSAWFPAYELHLALFMFSAGYFYKKSSESNVKKYIIKKIKKLIIPLYIYNFIYGIIVQLLKLKGFKIGSELSIRTLFIDQITTGHQFRYNLGGWFVIPLFMIEIYNILLRKIFAKINLPEYIYFLINILLGAIGNYISYKGYNTGWWLVLARMMHFLPYFGLGIFYKNCFEEYEKKISTEHLLLLIFIVKSYMLIAGCKQSFSPAWCNDFSKNPFTPIIVAFLGIFFYMRLATILEPVIGKNKYLNLIADNTYSIMINHFIFFMGVKTLFAIISKLTDHCSGFDWVKYKTDIWYYYIPKGTQSLIIYLAAGIIGPISIQLLINRIKKFVTNN